MKPDAYHKCSEEQNKNFLRSRLDRAALPTLYRTMFRLLILLLAVWGLSAPAGAQMTAIADDETDPLCLALGPIVSAGMERIPFASLTPETAAGRYSARLAPPSPIAQEGAITCLITIPSALQSTRNAPYNQVSCRLGETESEDDGLEAYAARRDALSERIARCPAIVRWEKSWLADDNDPGGGERPAGTDASSADVTPVEVDSLQTRSGPDDARVFSYPYPAMEIVLSIGIEPLEGRWTPDFRKTYTLIFRAPNPLRPAQTEAGGS